MTTLTNEQTLAIGGAETGAYSVLHAKVGDHPLIGHLLQESLYGPCAQEFQSELEDPHYSPSDRLLIKRGGRIAAHVRVSRREMRLGNRTVPISLIDQLVTLPEHRGQGLASTLLAAAEQYSRSEGCVVAMLSTAEPAFFQKRGWANAATCCYSQASAREILASLHDTQLPPPRDVVPGHEATTPESLTIRLWRHVEQGALERLYHENTKHSYGPLVRDSEYWRWLISRRAFERIYVAIEGPNKLDLCDDWTAIIGYAVMRDGQILELMTATDATPERRREAARQLLARACGDAIENDQHSVRLDAPVGQPLHEILAASGRFKQTDSDGGQLRMMKLFNPLDFLDTIRADLYSRAKAAELAQPCELGLSIEGEKYRLVLSPRSIQLSKGKLSRSYLELSEQQLGQLCLGCLDVRQAIATGKMQASTRVAIDTAAILFPQLPIWRPGWDELWV